MKFIQITLVVALMLSSLAVFGQKVQLKTTFSYENFEGEIPDNYAFTYSEENGKTVINITSESMIYDIIQKHDIPVNRLNPTRDNYQFWAKKYNEKVLDTPFQQAILMDLMTAMKREIFKR